jgi:2'-5' RNA ligase
MINRYNLAFIPTTEKDNIIKLAQNFSAISDQYMLGEKSFPHVTLYQFTAQESDISGIWESVRKSLDTQPITFVFEKFSCITVGDKSWVSLLPDQNEVLQQMYNIVSERVKSPVKKTFNYYDPHMTLISTKEAKFEETANKVAESYKPIKDDFVLSLGKSDDLGQLIEVIYSCQAEKKNEFRR